MDTLVICGMKKGMAGEIVVASEYDAQRYNHGEKKM